MDDQQRARAQFDAWAKSANKTFHGFNRVEDMWDAWQAATAALRAAPEVPAARVTEPLRADESRQEQADLAIYNRGWNDCRAALLNQHGVAVVADSSQVVPPPALGAHEVHPEAVDAGLDLGKSGERLLAADALEHAASVSTDCDGSATAPDRFVLVPEVMDMEMEVAFCEAWFSKRRCSDDPEMQDAWAAALAARPQGVK